MVVMKFGGTSVMDASCMKEVAQLVFASASLTPTIVVLSAMKGITDDLLEVAEIASQSHQFTHQSANKEQKAYTIMYKKIVDRHQLAWKKLVESEDNTIQQLPFPAIATATLQELEEILHGINLIQECTDRTKDLMLSFGERLSCCLFANYLEYCVNGVSGVMVDARECIVTNNRHGAASVVFAQSYAKIKTHITTLLQKPNIIPVVTGFIAATEDGITTTLGRNGSDYTASLVGAALGVDSIEIWTDVDGILSADPRITSNAFVVPRISYNEAMELSYFGAKVIHPQTVVPAIEKEVPILIKNTKNSQSPGTLIEKYAQKHKYPITGLASVKTVSLLTIEGAGLSGNFYFLPDVFGVFALHHVQPLMITQASSEHSISFVLNAHDAPLMKTFLEKTFSEELEARRMQQINVKKDCSIISVIGSHMRGTRGLAGRIFNAMGLHDINVIAIAQGSNEINVSFVVEKKEEQSAIRVLHEEFFEKTKNAKKGKKL